MKKTKLQSIVLQLRKFWPLRLAFALWYKIALLAFVFFTTRVHHRMGGHILRSVYLRRGGGRNEILPGASDLDFFLLLQTLSAEQEMEFLKEFWESYHRYRYLFPFFGEVLMGDENELRNWFALPTVRSYEARFSWKTLWGNDVIKNLPSVEKPELRDLFSEALKCYWAILQPVLKIRPEQFHQNISVKDAAAVHLRHAAKASIDLFRIHASLKLEGSSLDQLWRQSRKEFLQNAAYRECNNLTPLLDLQEPLFQEDPFQKFSAILYRAFLALDEMAAVLEKQEEKKESWKVKYHEKPGAADAYSLSVRELFAERLLLRHQLFLQRAVLSQNTAHMYFPLHKDSGLEGMRALLTDLRDVSFSFDRFSVAMPVSERTFKQIEKTSLLDTPFHSFYAHTEVRFSPSEGLKSARYVSPQPEIPTASLQKTFAELSFALRYQPLELEFLLEKMLALVLSLRLAGEHGEIVTDFDACLQAFSERYPLRVGHLKEKLAPYLGARSERELALWNSLYQALDQFQAENPTRVAVLKAQLEALQKQSIELPKSKTLATDLWINLTPFLRMEMNAMKDRYFQEKPRLKI